MPLAKYLKQFFTEHYSIVGMKTKMNFDLFLVLFIISILIGLMSCKNETKEQNIPLPVNIVSELFKAHSWRFNETFFLYKSGSYYPYALPACLLDDKLDYSDNTLYIKDPKNELCAGQKQKSDTLVWKLMQNNSKLEITNKGIVTINDIIRISDDSLITSSVTPAGDTQVYLYLRYR